MTGNRDSTCKPSWKVAIRDFTGPSLLFKLFYRSLRGMEPITTVNNGMFKPGNAGRPTGTTNHLTKTVKETVLAVFNELQDEPETALKSFARKYPRDFYNIAAKLIPTEFAGSIKHVITVTDLPDE